MATTLDLTDGCGACAALCCVGLAFSRSADFPSDKAAGAPCPNLDAADRCAVHADLLPLGFRGCVTYSCFGAGQAVTAAHAPSTWRDDAGTAASMFAALPVTRMLHELCWYLAAALEEGVDDELRGALLLAQQRTVGMARQAARAPNQVDALSQRDEVNALLRLASARLRGPRPGRDLGGADLAGADLRRADLRAASLRGALLVGADLRGARARRADWTGADLRGADLAGADLRDALFLTPSQLRSARGSGTTRLPPAVDRPDHWEP
ncbi:MAG TPA: pentapeptide repeat-containing protein [Candidatus Nanopelagicales bacterium]